MTSISVGPMSLSIGHLSVLVALLLALLVGGLMGRRYGVPVAGPVADIFLGAMIAARLGFVGEYFEHYRNDLLGIIDIRDGGFDAVWGVIGALAMTLYLLWRRQALRRALTVAVATGALFWAGTTATIALIEQQARGIPEVALTALDGEPSPLPDLAKGKPMVVNLWATWCPPCIREMPVLQQAQERDSDVVYVFANQREHPGTIREFLADQQLEVNNVYLDKAGQLARASGSHGLPTTLFYNADGQLVDSHMGQLSHATLARSLDKFGQRSNQSDGDQQDGNTTSEEVQ
ncbi:TlpA disulfide reductase family protein [Marinobacter sp. M216]|uniref:TlpA disulfide reductase family protein n=1 Tax=Marinobacter albus TaxID=3030833 RepID=A0ABT7H6R0_9GAMM|nr:MULTISPECIES: TlpA disulfide reductase family protein [unclassified Marinobacter]MBW7471634.1 TlpA family protein disulfide reductase [Marinobacter sp. F4218]MDK9556049.1 TlpA disulfide reductase family protein [Marinobacter sp. M216]